MENNIVYKNKIKEKLQEHKLEHGETFVHVASRIGVTKQQIDINFKTNAKNITIGTLVNIARALNCEISELIEVIDIERNNYRII